MAKSVEKATGLSRQYTLSLQKILVWSVCGLVTVSGATFALARIMIADEIGALRVALQDVNWSESRDAASRHSKITDTVFANENSTPDERRLLSELSTLERQRNELVAELAKHSTDNLAPEGELAKLISELASDSEQRRQTATKMLFELGDKRAIGSLVTYFRKDPHEATFPPAPSSYRWHRDFYKMDPIAGLQFSLSELESDSNDRSEDAYDALQDYIDRNAIAPAVLGTLRAVALQNENSVVRTRAKMLLRLAERSARALAGPNDRRSLYQIVLDIEKRLSEIRGPAPSSSPSSTSLPRDQRRPAETEPAP